MHIRTLLTLSICFCSLMALAGAKIDLPCEYSMERKVGGKIRVRKVTEKRPVELSLNGETLVLTNAKDTKQKRFIDNSKITSAKISKKDAQTLLDKIIESTKSDEFKKLQKENKDKTLFQSGQVRLAFLEKNNDNVRANFALQIASVEYRITKSELYRFRMTLNRVIK